MEEISTGCRTHHIRIDIFGWKIAELTDKGVDFEGILKSIGCSEYHISEVKICKEELETDRNCFSESTVSIFNNSQVDTKSFRCSTPIHSNIPLILPAIDSQLISRISRNFIEPIEVFDDENGIEECRNDPRGSYYVSFPEVPSVEKEKFGSLNTSTFNREMSSCQKDAELASKVVDETGSYTKQSGTPPSLDSPISHKFSKDLNRLEYQPDAEESMETGSVENDNENETSKCCIEPSIKCRFTECEKMFCWETSYGKNRLVDHALSHSQDDLLECKFCAFKCKAVHNLRKHHRSKHPNRRLGKLGGKKLVEILSEEKINGLWKLCFPEQGDLKSFMRKKPRRRYFSDSHKDSKKRNDKREIKQRSALDSNKQAP